MKQVLQYFKNYKWKAILAPLFKMLEAAFELLVPLVMAAIIDNGIAGNDKPYIYKMAFVMVGLGVIGLGCSITAQYFSAKTAMGIGKEIRYDLFKHIETLSYTEIDRLGSATLITRMTSDVNQVQTGINMFLRLFPVYCVRCNNHGIYGQCEGVACVLHYASGSDCDRIWNYACFDSFV